MRPISDLPRSREMSEYWAVIDQTEGATDDESLMRRGFAFWKLGTALYEARELEDAARCSHEAAFILVKVPSVAIIGLLARAGQGRSLVMLGRYEEALAPLDDAVEAVRRLPRLLDLTRPELKGTRVLDTLARAAILKVHALEQLGLTRDADALAQFVIDEFAAGDSASQRLAVTKALIDRARYARQRGDLDGALAAIDDAIAHSGTSTADHAVRRVHSVALDTRETVVREAERTDAQD